ncbi:major facilitator superfamily protein [Wolffia australiana]
MGFVIERVEWELGSQTFLWIFCSCLASIFLLPYFSKKAGLSFSSNGKGPHSSLVEFGSSAFFSFQRSFLFVYILASVIGGLQTVFGEDEYQLFGFSRKQMVLCLCAGVSATVFFGSFLGVLSDMVGPKNTCMIYCVLHLFVGAMRSTSERPSVWISSLSLSLASFIFQFSFETWMTSEHEKQGHRREFLLDTFWLMVFFESASLIGGQGLANLLVTDIERGLFFPSAPAALLSVICALYIRKNWHAHKLFSLREYRYSFSTTILKDKRIWLLGCAQGCLHFAVSVFWMLWAPTVVADGRDVNLSLIYPCFLGSRMLGSTAFPWVSGPGSFIPLEDYLSLSFVAAGLSLTMAAYDYQEIGVLVALFCGFHACCGLILPSLARLRTALVPNELRAGMISFSLAPANASILFILIQGGYHRNLSNAAILAMAAFGLFTAAGCVHVLKRWKRRTPGNWHEL